MEMVKNGACALFLEMGTGKSAASIAVMGRLYLDGRIKRVLIVAPASVCAVWPDEFQRFAGYPVRVGLLLGDHDKRVKAIAALERPSHRISDPLRVAVINYESTWRLEGELEAFAPNMIICDESQRIKSHTAAQSKALHRLGDKAAYKMILSGTPMQQDSRDIWSQYRFLEPRLFGASYYGFEKRYAMMGGYGNHQYIGPRHLDELVGKMHSIALRVKKTDCLDLPEKTFEKRAVPLEPGAQKLYTRIAKESFAELDNGRQVTANIVLTRLLRLQQITGGFISDDEGKMTPVSKVKLEATADIIQSLCVEEGRKLVIFCRFTAEYDALCDLARQALGELRFVAIRGGVPTETRGQLVDQFQTDPGTRVFIGNLDACAEGITLTAADTVLYYSVNWNLAKYQQSQDRIHRIGQRNTCTYIHLIAPGTVDAKIMRALAHKEDLARAVVDNWRDLIGGMDA